MVGIKNLMPCLKVICQKRQAYTSNKVKNEIEGVGKSGKTAEKGVKGFGSSLSSVIGTAALVAGAVASVGLAIREVYEDLKEGAEHEQECIS